MSQVTFSTRFQCPSTTSRVSLPTSRQQPEKLVQSCIRNEWEDVSFDIFRSDDNSRKDILRNIAVQGKSIACEYQAAHSILVDTNDPIQRFTYTVRNGMLYEQFSFCEEWWKGFGASLGTLSGLGIALYLGRKVIFPLILSIPCIYNRLNPLKNENLLEAVDREMKAYLPLKALAGIVAHFCLSILWLITLGLLSPWINYIRGDIERWENGHMDLLGKCRGERVSEMPYFMPSKQPICTFKAELAPKNGEVDLMTTTCIPEKHKKAIARHIMAQKVDDSFVFELTIDGKPVSIKRVFPISAPFSLHHLYE